MILFLTHQTAGAEYLLPLARRWAAGGSAPPAPWEILASGPSVAVWRANGFEVKTPPPDPGPWLAEFFESQKPRLVVASASVGAETETTAVALAQRTGAAAVQFLDMWSRYRDRFLDGEGRPVWPDRILAIDERGRGEMIADGLPSERIVVVGQPAWESFVNLAAPPQNDHILLVSQPIAAYYGSALGYTEALFLDVCLAGLERAGWPGPVVVSRHPEEETGQLTPRPGINVRQVKGAGPSDLTDARTVVGMFSTLLILAYLIGRRTLVVQPGLKGEDPCPLSRWGLRPRLESEAEVAAALRSPGHAFDPSPIQKALPGSLDRLEAVILELLSGKRTSA
ncbi:MAG: hypothetical protein KJ621_17595 [Proteobacteria bacterium]|nr:hypothetical protein [Pseudomonadota bacterium]MBU1741301.1 hypothetical protein [Pseudomonadota bacterium]